MASWGSPSPNDPRVIPVKKDAPAPPKPKNPPVRCTVAGVYPGKEEHEFVMCIKARETRGLYGAFQLQCLAGAVMVNAATINEQKLSDAEGSWTTVCAPYKGGRPVTLGCTSGGTTGYSLYRLKWRINEVSRYADEMMEYLGDITKPLCVLLIYKKPTAVCRIAQHIAPTLLIPPPEEKIAAEFTNSLNCFLVPFHEVLRSYDDGSDVAITEAIARIHAIRETEKITIVMAGVKNMGKSTFTRRLANILKTEAAETPVFILDVDIGQSEFTPAGCLSLTRVDKFICDEPFTHQRRYFENAYLFGDITVKEETESKYKAIVDRLLERYAEMCNGPSILIINTMGWIKDTGRSILDHIMVKTTPQIVFNFQAHFSSEKYTIPPSIVCRVWEVPMLWNRNFLNKNGTGPTPAILREITMVCYMSQCLPKSRPVIAAFSELCPYRNTFDKLCLVFNFDHASMSDHTILASLNMQMVALCTFDGERNKFDKSRRRLMDSDLMPWLVVLPPDARPLRVIAFALIRGMSLEKREIYMITPLEQRRMGEIECIVRCANINVPNSMIQAQNFVNVPYTMHAMDGTVARENKLTIDLYGEFQNRTRFLRR